MWSTRDGEYILHFQWPWILAFIPQIDHNVFIPYPLLWHIGKPPSPITLYINNTGNVKYWEHRSITGRKPCFPNAMEWGFLSMNRPSRLWKMVEIFHVRYVCVTSDGATKSRFIKQKFLLRKMTGLLHIFRDNCPLQFTYHEIGILHNVIVHSF